MFAFVFYAFRRAAEAAKESAMKVSERLIPEFDNEMASTRKLLSVLPDKITDYKPHPKSMPIAHLA